MMRVFFWAIFFCFFVSQQVDAAICGDLLVAPGVHISHHLRKLDTNIVNVEKLLLEKKHQTIEITILGRKFARHSALKHRALVDFEIYQNYVDVIRENVLKTVKVRSRRESFEQVPQRSGLLRRTGRTLCNWAGWGLIASGSAATCVGPGQESPLAPTLFFGGVLGAGLGVGLTLISTALSVEDAARDIAYQTDSILQKNPNIYFFDGIFIPAFKQVSDFDFDFIRHLKENFAKLGFL